jgi:hypothetical protein
VGPSEGVDRTGPKLINPYQKTTPFSVFEGHPLFPTLLYLQTSAPTHTCVLINVNRTQFLKNCCFPAAPNQSEYMKIAKKELKIEMIRAGNALKGYIQWYLITVVRKELPEVNALRD